MKSPVFALLLLLIAAPALADRIAPVEGRTLENDTVALPDLFTDPRSALLLTFERDHQELANQWDAALDEGPRWQVLVIDRPGRILRGLIRRGMRGEVPEAAQDRMVILWLEDFDGWVAAAGLDPADGMQVAVIDRDGRILGTVAGPPDADRLSAVKSLMDAATP